MLHYRCLQFLGYMILGMCTGAQYERRLFIQGGIEGRENTPLGDENKIYIPYSNKKYANVSHTRKKQQRVFQINKKSLKRYVSCLPQ